VSAQTDDIVLQWNQTILDSIRAERTLPPVAARALAMVHIAMYDSLNEIEGQHTPYSYTFPGIRVVNPSPNVSASTAAYIVASYLYPAREPIFRQQWLASFASGDGAVRNATGVTWGTYVGNRVIDYRRNDGASRTVVYTPSGLVGRWKPTLPNFTPALLPQWPNVLTFGVTEKIFYRPAAPPGLETIQFANAYNEVKRLGAVNSTVRTADQTQIAMFWEDGPGSVTPPGHWQVIARDLSRRYRLNRVQNARLFALLSIAQADAGICCWDAKYRYDYFRPITGITEKCSNRSDVVTDPTWRPLLPTPAFAAYSSGHSTFSSASARLLALYFGTDRIAFSGPSPDPPRWPQLVGVVRSWSSLSQAAAEAGQSRIFGGIHWQFDNTAGVTTGRGIAESTFDIHMRPKRR
jgi:hypothetical protein